MICTREARQDPFRPWFREELSREVKRCTVILSSACPTCGGDLEIEHVQVTRDGITRKVKVARCNRKIYRDGVPCRDTCCWVEVEIDA